MHYGSCRIQDTGYRMTEKQPNGQTGQRANGPAEPSIDVLCVGHAAYDLIFSVPHHPGPDEKCMATALASCGGGPAANAAVTVARLGLRSAFAGYLGKDLFGERHLQELHHEGVNTDLVVRRDWSTPLSVVLVKPGGERSLVNHRENSGHLPADTVADLPFHPKVILFDGHEPLMAGALVQYARSRNIPTVLDAGSVHPGTEKLVSEVDYLVASTAFAHEFTGLGNPGKALLKMGNLAPCVVITLGREGSVWHRGQESGTMSAVPISAVDTTGAGDAFHGAFSAGLARRMGWNDLLQLSNTVAALCCLRMGARTGIPTLGELAGFLKRPIEELLP